MKHLTHFLLALTLTLLATRAQATVVTVGGGTSVTCPAVPTATYTTPPDGVTFANWSRGSGVTCSSALDGISGSAFNTASAAASLAANKFYKITITADATHAFTLDSITWLATISSGTGTLTVKTSNNGGPTNDFGSAAVGVTGSAISATFNGSVAVAPGTSVDVFLIPSNLGAVGTTCRFKNNSTFTVTGLPSVSSAPATGVTNTTGTINGSVNPNGAATTAWFEWGATTNYGNQTAPVALGSGILPLTLNSNLTGFTQGITNHYRLVATNSVGTTLGSDIAFGSPIVTLIGAANLTNECHFAFTDPGANNSAGFAVSVSVNLNTNLPNTYPLTYTGTNTLGGVGTTTRTVVVNDTLPPVVTVLGANPLTNLLNAPFVDPGATATDACAGNLAVGTNNTVNISVAGFYTNTYTASDGNGYSATNTRVVFVRPPATLMVLNNNDSGAGSLRQAITDAESGATINFTNTLSGGDIVLTSTELLLNKNLTIDASSLTNGITLNGNDDGYRVFNIASGTTNVLTALTIVNGAPFGNGGGIINSGNLSLNHCTVANNSASSGGGIYNSGTLTLHQCTLSGNYANSFGGGIRNTVSGTLTLNQCTLSGNRANTGTGGGIGNIGTLNLTNTIVAGNTAASSDDIAGSTTTSGGVNLTSGFPMLAALGNYGGPTPTMPPLPGSPAIDGCTNGSPAFATDQRGFARVVDGDFNGTAVADIGAVEFAPRIVTSAADDGGAGTLRTIIANAFNGDLILFTNTLSGATIVLTNASGELLLNKNLTIDGSALTNGISISGNNAHRVFEIASGTTNVLTALTITNGNSGGGDGGGIYNQGALTVNNCTLAGNSADTGAGIRNASGASLSVNQSTLANNTAGFGGGGIFNYGGTVIVRQSTVSANSALNGSGLFNDIFATMIISNSIVAGNTGFGSDIYNGGGGTFLTINNTIGGAPLLAPLGNYGGPTQTMPPLPGSPAIDGCTSGTTFATDQRGFPRIVGSFADIGAVEANWPTNVYVDPAKTWIGYMNVFTNLGGTAGTFEFGSGWGTADLNALFTGPTLTLTPNTSIDRDVPSDPYWWVGGTTNGAPAKIMDANFYVQNDALAGGQTVIFSAYCKSNTLVAPYISVAFIKDFVPDYSSLIQTNVAVVTGQPFSIALTTSAGHHIQYGFETVGPNARIATVAALGKVIINSNAPVVIVATTPPVLTNVVVLGNGSFRFNFTSTPGASLTVWGSTNVALPFAQWIYLGAPVESPAGTFTFTDAQAVNNAQRFYRVTSP